MTKTILVLVMTVLTTPTLIAQDYGIDTPGMEIIELEEFGENWYVITTVDVMTDEAVTSVDLWSTDSATGDATVIRYTNFHNREISGPVLGIRAPEHGIVNTGFLLVRFDDNPAQDIDTTMHEGEVRPEEQDAFIREFISSEVVRFRYSTRTGLVETATFTDYSAQMADVWDYIGWDIPGE